MCMSFTYKEWTLRLRHLRERTNLRQEDIADKLHISRSQYNAIENARSIVNYNHLLDLAKAFRLPLAQMVTLKGVRRAPTKG